MQWGPSCLSQTPLFLSQTPLLAHKLTEIRVKLPSWASDRHVNLRPGDLQAGHCCMFLLDEGSESRHRASPSHQTQVSRKWVLCIYAQSCPTLCNPMDCSPPGSSVHGILQARILKWVACPPPGDLPDPGDWTHISCIFCIGSQVLHLCTTWETQMRAPSPGYH